jgi:hypothetical protein
VERRSLVVAVRLIGESKAPTDQQRAQQAARHHPWNEHAAMAAPVHARRDERNEDPRTRRDEDRQHHHRGRHTTLALVRRVEGRSDEDQHAEHREQPERERGDASNTHGRLGLVGHRARA